MAVPIEIWYTQSLTRSIVLQTLSYKRHRLEQDKLLISASKVDTPSNIDSQTFLSRDTETPDLPQISLNGTKNYCYIAFTPEDQLVAKKMQER